MDDAVLDAWINAGTQALDIDMHPDWLPAVRTHLKISLGHAQTVTEPNMPDHLDPAPVYRA